MKEEYVLEKITELRKERNWTLYRLAKEADVSYSTLSNTFHRDNVPSIPTLIRLCDGLGITMSEFFDEKGILKNQLTVSDQNLLADWHQLPKTDRGLVKAYIQGLLKTTEIPNDIHTEEEELSGDVKEQGA